MDDFFNIRNEEPSALQMFWTTVLIVGYLVGN